VRNTLEPNTLEDWSSLPWVLNLPFTASLVGITLVGSAFHALTPSLSPTCPGHREGNETSRFTIIQPDLLGKEIKQQVYTCHSKDGDTKLLNNRLAA